MQFKAKFLRWSVRKRLSKDEPDIFRFYWLPRFEWNHRKPRPGPDGPRSHEYRLWILIGWSGVYFEFIDT